MRLRKTGCGIFLLFFLCTLPYSGSLRSQDYFFGRGDKHEEMEEVYSSAFSNSSSGITQENQTRPGDWEEKDLLPSFPELQILDDISSQRSLDSLRRAQHLYNLAVRESEAGKKESDEKLAEEPPAGLRFEWEKNEFKERMKRESARILARHRASGMVYIVQALNLLPDVKNPQIAESADFAEAKARIYRMYIKLQFQSRNLVNCITVLRQYLALSEERMREAEPHRLLAACYRQQEVSTRRMNNRNVYLDYKRLKNQELLLYAKLQYGPDSNEFRTIRDQVDRDMMIEE